MQIKDIIKREEERIEKKYGYLKQVITMYDEEFFGSLGGEQEYKKFKSFLKSSLRRVAKEAYRMGHIDHQLQLEGVTKELIKDMQKEGMLPKPKVKKTE